MTIQTGQIRDFINRDVEKNLYPVLITRFWPRGIKKFSLKIKAWEKDFAPSRTLLKQWRNKEIDWSTFKRKYMNEIMDNSEAFSQLQYYKIMGGFKDVILLCYESSDDPHCHRYILKELINNIELPKFEVSLDSISSPS